MSKYKQLKGPREPARQNRTVLSGKYQSENPLFGAAEGLAVHISRHAILPSRGQDLQRAEWYDALEGAPRDPFIVRFDPANPSLVEHHLPQLRNLDSHHPASHRRHGYCGAIDKLFAGLDPYTKHTYASQKCFMPQALLNPLRDILTEMASLVAAGNLPAPLPPSVEEAYRKKCIELKRRMTEVEESNDAFRLRKVRLTRAIRKMRLERAYLLETLGKRMKKNGIGSDELQGIFDEESEGSSEGPPTVNASPSNQYSIH